MSVNFEAASSRRDPRLDFFRGLAMFIIFVSHTPGNWLAGWIPARMGFSDATEIFVFCSGMASAIAFGRVFEDRGLAMGTARIMHRVWQVYWAHIAVFFAVVAQLLLTDKLLNSGGAFTGTLNLHVFFENIRDGILGLLTLSYVPNYWDILPMYLVILLMIPLIVTLRRLHPYLPFVFCIGLWLISGQQLLELPAEPWSDRSWFFNPFSWQLVFFAGFAYMRGWLPVPPIRKDWMIVCAVILLMVIPFANWKIWTSFEFLRAVRDAVGPLLDKTHLGLFRFVHFLLLAYLAYSIVTLLGDRFSGGFVDIVRKVGQQSLGVFMSSLVLSQAAGTLISQMGYNYFSMVVANALGFAALIAVAILMAWFKSSPWKKPARFTPQTQPAPGSRSGLGAGTVGFGSPVVASPAECKVKDKADYESARLH